MVSLANVQQELTNRKRGLREKQALEHHAFNTNSCGLDPRCTDIFNCPFAQCVEETRKPSKPGTIGRFQVGMGSVVRA